MKERLQFVDTAKFITIFFVVVSHAPLLIGQTVSVWLSVPQVFFILHGFIVTKDISYTDLLKEYKKLIKRILIPYLIFSLLYAVASSVRYDHSISTQTFIDILYASCNGIRRSSFMHLWFLPCYMVSVCIFLLCEVFAHNSLAKRITTCLSLLVLGRLFEANEDIPWSINTAFIGVLFIYIGKCLRFVYESRKDSLNNGKLSCLYTLSFVAYILLTWVNGYEEPIHEIHTMVGSRFGNIVIFVISSIFLSTAILSLSLLYNNKYISKLGQNTMALYLLHVLFLGVASSCLDRLFNFIGFDNIWIPTLIATIFTLAISQMVSKMIKRYIPFVFGEKSVRCDAEN